MKGKVKATGEIREVYEKSITHWYDAVTDEYYYPFEIEFLPDANEKVIYGWVARDKDTMLRLHYTEPQRQRGGYWQGDFKSTYLPESLFPEVTWGSEPKHVRITLTPME